MREKFLAGAFALIFQTGFQRKSKLASNLVDDERGSVPGSDEKMSRN